MPGDEERSVAEARTGVEGHRHKNEREGKWGREAHGGASDVSGATGCHRVGDKILLNLTLLESIGHI